MRYYDPNKIADISDQEAGENICNMNKTGIRVVSELIHADGRSDGPHRYEIWAWRAGLMLSFNRTMPEAPQLVVDTFNGKTIGTVRKHEDKEYILLGIYGPNGATTKKGRYEHLLAFIQAQARKLDK